MVSVGEPLRYLKYILTRLFNEKYLLALGSPSSSSFFFLYYYLGGLCLFCCYKLS